MEKTQINHLKSEKKDAGDNLDLNKSNSLQPG